MVAIMNIISLTGAVAQVAFALSSVVYVHYGYLLTMKHAARYARYWAVALCGYHLNQLGNSDDATPLASIVRPRGNSFLDVEAKAMVPQVRQQFRDMVVAIGRNAHRLELDALHGVKIFHNGKPVRRFNPAVCRDREIFERALILLATSSQVVVITNVDTDDANGGDDNHHRWLFVEYDSYRKVLYSFYAAGVVWVALYMWHM
jgi:hypothetical protein